MFKWILFSFAILLVSPANVHAQYEAYEVPVPEYLKTNACQPGFLTENEEILWFCEKDMQLTYRTSKNGTDLYLDLSEEGSRVIAWGGPRRYLKYLDSWDYRTEPDSLYLCDPDCKKLPLPAGASLWPSFRLDVSGMRTQNIRFNPRGEALVGYQLEEKVIRTMLISANFPNGDYPYRDVDLGGVFYPTSDLYVYANDNNQVAYWLYAGRSLSKFWNGERFITMPAGIKKNFFPVALLSDGQLLATMADISWNMHLYSFRNRKRTEININASKRFPVGSFILGAWPAADGSVLMMAYSSSKKGLYFFQVKGKKARFLKDPLPKRWIDGPYVANSCGSVVLTNFYYKRLGDDAPHAYILHKVGC